MTEIKTPKNSEGSETIPAFTPVLLKKMGQAIAGRHWQADIARETGKSKAQITRYLKSDPKDGRTPTHDFGFAMDRLIVDKIEDIAEFIGHKGSPNVGNPKFTKAIALIREGISILREISPKGKRHTIEETSTRKKLQGRKKKNVS